MRKANARAAAQGASEDAIDSVALWTAGLWVVALIYLLATFDPIH